MCVTRRYAAISNSMHTTPITALRDADVVFVFYCTALVALRMFRFAYIVACVCITQLHTGSYPGTRAQAEHCALTLALHGSCIFGVAGLSYAVCSRLCTETCGLVVWLC